MSYGLKQKGNYNTGIKALQQPPNIESIGVVALFNCSSKDAPFISLSCAHDLANSSTC